MDYPSREIMIDLLVESGGIRERLEKADDETLKKIFMIKFIKLQP